MCILLGGFPAVRMLLGAVRSTTAVLPSLVAALVVLLLAARAKTGLDLVALSYIHEHDVNAKGRTGVHVRNQEEGNTLVREQWDASLVMQMCSV
jgi:hypothetical protein